MPPKRKASSSPNSPDQSPRRSTRIKDKKEKDATASPLPDARPVRKLKLIVKKSNVDSGPKHVKPAPASTTSAKEKPKAIKSKKSSPAIPLPAPGFTKKLKLNVKKPNANPARKHVKPPPASTANVKPNPKDATSKKCAPANPRASKSPQAKKQPTLKITTKSKPKRKFEEDNPLSPNNEAKPSGPAAKKPRIILKPKAKPITQPETPLRTSPRQTSNPFASHPWIPGSTKIRIPCRVPSPSPSASHRHGQEKEEEEEPYPEGHMASPSLAQEQERRDRLRGAGLGIGSGSAYVEPEAKAFAFDIEERGGDIAGGFESSANSPGELRRSSVEKKTKKAQDGLQSLSESAPTPAPSSSKPKPKAKPKSKIKMKKSKKKKKQNPAPKNRKTKAQIAEERREFSNAMPELMLDMDLPLNPSYSRVYHEDGEGNRWARDGSRHWDDRGGSLVLNVRRDLGGGDEGEGEGEGEGRERDAKRLMGKKNSPGGKMRIGWLVEYLKK